MRRRRTWHRTCCNRISSAHSLLRGAECLPCSQSWTVRSSCTVGRLEPVVAFATLLALREFKCPVGQWSINWMNELQKHVRPEISGQVRELMDLLLRVWHLHQAWSALCCLWSQSSSVLQSGMDTDTISTSSLDFLRMMQVNGKTEQDLMRYLLP